MKPKSVVQPDESVALHDRVAHIEGEVGSIHAGMDGLRATMEKVWEKIDGLSSRGQPSWQAIMAFGFSALTALVTVAGVVGAVITMFVHQETAAINIRQDVQEKVAADLLLKVDRSREEKIAELREALRRFRPASD